MSRRDYVAIAADVRYVFEHLGHVCGAHYLLAARLADTLAADNPRFDRKKFLRACGIEIVQG